MNVFLIDFIKKNERAQNILITFNADEKKIIK